MEQKEMTLEESLSEVENIIGKMQQREISLEESFSFYQQGVELLKECEQKIDAVEKKMILLSEEGAKE